MWRSILRKPAMGWNIRIQKWVPDYQAESDV